MEGWRKIPNGQEEQAEYELYGAMKRRNSNAQNGEALTRKKNNKREEKAAEKDMKEKEELSHHCNYRHGQESGSQTLLLSGPHTFEFSTGHPTRARAYRHLRSRALLHTM